ncbi:hypothetical protein H2201_003240 [Coniosporium apollinis]|uniref:F-box domain-containing protein n=2 Tax=Coniosporium TaxID=2810619 RepID=A0ABQ9NXZ3_9PEZI|nr:hypothetical protein H2199_008712 [Cladosporium sp. JES 115]KAJ9666581.1 hypothetical protein H2201_003240 [Coniosporium apollinis]
MTAATLRDTIKRSASDDDAANNRAAKTLKTASNDESERDSTNSHVSASDKPLLPAQEDIKVPKPANLLMRLPGELRNEIYRLVLVKKKTLRVTKDSIPKQPQLTRVSRQIRKEAISIFYRENEFMVHAWGYDISHEHMWLSKIGPENAKLLSLPNGDINISYYFRRAKSLQKGRRCLDNLLLWLEGYYLGKPFYGRTNRSEVEREDRTDPMRIFLELFDAADELRAACVPWARAKRVLCSMAEVAECRPPCWNPEIE